MKKYISLVKFSHTIFAMPFALIGFCWGIKDNPNNLAINLLLVLGCMITARNCAMAFNRYIDRDVDALNPRTSSREIPSGEISGKNALLFIIANGLLFVVFTYFLNKLALYLSPIALAVVCGYSLTKRFTSLCHLVLGIALAIAPAGAYIAVTGEFTPLVLFLALLVTMWVGGFDILYALQDENFDKENSLHSIPQYFGIKKSLIISALMHLIAILTMFYIGITFINTPLYYIGSSIFTILLIYEHIVVKPNDISKVNLAFATMNGVGSLVYGLFTILAILVHC